MATIPVDHDGVISAAGRLYLRLHLAPGVGPICMRRLIERFGGIDAVLEASMSELQHVEGIGPATAESVFRARADDRVEYELDRAREDGVRILCWEDAGYPPPLKKIADPPICLFVRGTLSATDSVAVAIVGTRRCSHYGREQAVRFGELLGRAGFTVVSGLARGIDGEAHRGALRAGGRTVAVLGNGLATVYPREHTELATKVAAAGAVVSELPMDIQPTGENFPKRNRIIVGLSLGVIVIEAGARSGALITARLANESNREVFALPGRVDQPGTTSGVHALIRDGQAKLITCLEDVLDELGAVGEIMGQSGTAVGGSETARPDKAVGSVSPRLEGDDRAVFGVVAEETADADAICVRTGLGSGRVLSTLTRLQLMGLVKQLPGQRFVARNVGGRA